MKLKVTMMLGSSSNYLNFEGQKLGDNWIPLVFEIFKKKRKEKG